MAAEIDGWMEFLNARMRVIQSARSHNYDEGQIYNLIGVDVMQTFMLCHTADRLNREAKKNEQSTDGAG